MSGLVALGGFIMRQWVKYQRQSLKYQKELTDNIYFRNVNNNAGIFDYIIGAAEEQECKEAFLAYYFLQHGDTPTTQAELDRRIERWLKETFELDVDFEVDDALGKLDRLGLLRRDGERLVGAAAGGRARAARPVWDNYFQFKHERTRGGSAATQADRVRSPAEIPARRSRHSGRRCRSGPRSSSATSLRLRRRAARPPAPG